MEQHRGSTDEWFQVSVVIVGNIRRYGIDKPILASGSFDDGMKRRSGGFLHGWCPFLIVMYS